MLLYFLMDVEKRFGLLAELALYKRFIIITSTVILLLVFFFRKLNSLIILKIIATT